MDRRISQIQLVGAIADHLEKTEGVKRVLPREFNAIIAAANLVCEELAKPYRDVRPGMGLSEWLDSDCTGASSLFMVWTLFRVGPMRGCCHQYAYPRDPGDLWRCLGLCEAVPIERPDVDRMAATGPEWAALVGRWDELEATLREEMPSGSAPRTFAMMKECLKAQGDV